jgi:hypothetical protein
MREHQEDEVVTLSWLTIIAKHSKDAIKKSALIKRPPYQKK